MRRRRWCSVLGGFGALACWLARDGVAIAANGQMFPVRSHLVPVVVVAAFILPAAFAGVGSLAKRYRASPAALLGLGLLAVGALALAAIANPHLLAGVRI